MHDGIELEKAGIPSVAIVTDAFKAGIDALKEMRGMPNYSPAFVPHPIGPLSDDELRERAKLAAPLIAESILRHPDRPEAKSAPTKGAATPAK